MDRAIVLALGAVVAIGTFGAARTLRNRAAPTERSDPARTRLLWFRTGLAVLCVIGVVVGYVLTHP